jgi:hypothetical protein
MAHYLNFLNDVPTYLSHNIIYTIKYIIKSTLKKKIHLNLDSPFQKDPLNFTRNRDDYCQWYILYDGLKNYIR